MPADTTSACTCATIRRAARLLTGAYDRHLAPSGLRITQYMLLRQVAQRGPANVQTLARALGMDRTTLGRNLQPLERERLVTVATAPTDRRGRLIQITPAGMERLALAKPLWHRAQEQFEGAFGADQTAALHDTLHAVATAASA